MNIRGLPDGCLVRAVETVNNLVPQDAAWSMARQRMARNMANLILESGKVEVVRNDYSTDYRLEVYVLSPDDLHRMIQEEAMRLTYYMRDPMVKP